MIGEIGVSRVYPSGRNNTGSVSGNVTTPHGDEYPYAGVAATGVMGAGTSGNAEE